jgi:hypothetical protein
MFSSSFLFASISHHNNNNNNTILIPRLSMYVEEKGSKEKERKGKRKG